MPGADASQFTQLKKANAVAAASTPGNVSSKSVNRLTQHVIPLSAAASLHGSLNPPNGAFLPSLTAKSITPLLRLRLNEGGSKPGLPNCN
jgi:hypothetical protein